MQLRHLLYLFIFIFFSRCARVGRPVGGDKDITPPKVLKSTPRAGQAGFKGDEITLVFDEYVQIKNPHQNILLSPPPEQFPEIFPSGFASKVFKIKFKNPLQQNTTYLINFGESIVDYNEGNKLKDFQLIFSTGKQIDSLKFSGKVMRAHAGKKSEKIIIGLYPLENFKDSAVFQQKPYYVGIARKDGKFELTHLKKGRYKIIAIEDANNDYKYKTGDERIGFLNDTVSLPQDSTAQIWLFKEFPRAGIDKIEQKSRTHLIVHFKGNPDSLQVKPLTKLSKSTDYIQKNQYHLWYMTPDDTIRLRLKAGNQIKNYNRLRIPETDSLQVSVKKTKLALTDTLKLRTSMPVLACDTGKIKLQKDSLSIPFSCDFSPERQAYLIFQKQAGKYKLLILPAALTGFNTQKNKDSLQAVIKIEPAEKYGSLHLELKRKSATPVFVELINKDKVIRKSATSTQNKFDFPYLSPGQYQVRVVYDDNQNNRWDTGNYLLHQQPEKTFEPPVILDVRANWDLNQTIELPEK